MTELEISTRGVETHYNKVIDRDTEKDVAVSNHETQLRFVSVEVCLKRYSSKASDEYSRTFNIKFSVDHVEDEVKLHTVADSHGEIESLCVDKLCIALDVANEVLNSFLEDIGLDYTVITRSEFGLEEDVDATVHNNLENAK